METNDKRQTATIAGVLIIVIITIVFATVLFIPFPDLLSELFLRKWPRITLLLIGIFASMLFTLPLVMGLFVQFTQILYNLSLEDASQFVNDVMTGLKKYPPLKPILRVQEGRADPDGPEVLQKAGGPAYLSIGHDSVVVTSQHGILKRILGPGFHVLDPFEKLWDVVDLRPQRRTVTVEAMTRDGIPVYCEADIRFQIDNGDQAATAEIPYPYNEEAIWQAVMSKRSKGEGVEQNWMQRIAGGSLDGEIRDQLEKYRLDDFLTDNQHTQPLVAKLEEAVFKAAVDSGKGMGIKVEQVQVGPVLPKEEAISRQWLEVWQSEWQRFAAQQIVEGEVKQLQVVELARSKAEIDLVTRMLPTIQQMNADGKEIDPRLILLRFWEVLQSIAQQEPPLSGELQGILRDLVGESLLSMSGVTPASNTSKALEAT
ncbi:MAG: SPFH domain-containing protein [Anaerolineae bacterium]|nr:SPFH domain-containing protein [Anaerolineae bacterium]